MEADNPHSQLESCGVCLLQSLLFCGHSLPRSPRSLSTPHGFSLPHRPGTFHVLFNLVLPVDKMGTPTLLVK